jgi:hypothetical protein
MQICVCVNMCVCVYIYIYIYIHINMHVGRREALANMESKLKEEEDRAAAAAHARSRLNEPLASTDQGMPRNGRAHGDNWSALGNDLLKGTRMQSDGTTVHDKKDGNGGWQWKGGSGTTQVEHTRALVQEMKDDILRRHKALMAR